MIKKRIRKCGISLCLAFVMLLCPVVHAEQSAEELTPPESYTVIKALRNFIHQMHQYEVSDEKILDTLIKKMLSEDDSAENFEFIADAITDALDEHSVYFTPEETAKFTEDVSAEFGGVGVALSVIDGNCIVMRVLEDTPADGSGIVPGDKILAVNGQNVQNTDLDLIVPIIRGAIGTSVTLTILSENGTTWDKTLTRGLVTSPSAGYALNEKQDTAHIVITQFAADTATQFQSILSELKEKNIKKIIIDLRNNTGGYTDQAYIMASAFLPENALIYQEHSRSSGIYRQYSSRNKTPDTDTEIVVLINEYTASASEIFTGALKDNKRATIIGMPSFGKGTVQTITSMGDYGSLKLTIAEFQAPSGATINKVGIQPHIRLENTTRPVENSDLLPLSLENKYRLGDESPEICAIKQRLSYIGLYDEDIKSPVFDKALELAVLQYQAAVNLYPYGVADINTQLTLQTEVKNGTMRIDNQLKRAYEVLGTEE